MQQDDYKPGHVDRTVSGEAGGGANPPHNVFEEGHSKQHAEEESIKRHGQLLAQAFKERKVHPVLIIGTSGSGKTTFLQSLIAYALRAEEPGLDLNFIDSVFPDSYPNKKARDSNRKNFVEKMIASFKRREYAPRTQLPDGPFFIPISINPHSEPQPLQFAFLDSMGEWIEREGVDETEKATGPYRSLRWEIRTLLTTFADPISIIFMAPSVGIEQQTREYSHQCVANAMLEYQKCREAKQRDNVLLLASKWDAICNPDDPRSNFGDATAFQAVQRIKNWVVWPRFCNIDGIRPGARSFMPYSATRGNSDGVMMIGGEHAEVFDQFNRTIWNWLYGNATEQPFSVRKRQVLYTDVMPGIAERVPIYQSLNKLFLFRSRADRDEHR